MTAGVLTELAAQLMQQGLWLRTAESCTGGLIAATCTQRAGASAWFDSACVTYSNAAKTRLLGVDAALIQAHGAVSEEVAKAMALGACAGQADIVAVAVTGVAGPDGGTPAKPVGTVWIAWAVGTALWAQCFHLSGNRDQVRLSTVDAALAGLLAHLKNAVA
jgi:nicotinamide-nucleotide amidase